MDNMKTLRKWITMEMNSLEDGIVYDAARRTFKLVLDLMDLLEEENESDKGGKDGR